MERRDFTKRSSISSAGLTLGLGGISCDEKIAAISGSIPESEKMRVGIVGIGDRGNSIIKCCTQ